MQVDIFVVALGDIVKEEVIVIDVGITRVTDPSKKRWYELKGDVNFESVSPKCEFITPVYRWSGSKTVVSLMQNTLSTAEEK